MIAPDVFKSPPLWVSVFDGGEFRAAFVCPHDALASLRGAFTASVLIHIDAQLRDRWLDDDRAVATEEEYPIHPTRAELGLFAQTARADLQHLSLDQSGGSIYWHRNREVLHVAPEYLREELIAQLGTGSRQKEAA